MAIFFGAFFTACSATGSPQVTARKSAVIFRKHPGPTCYHLGVWLIHGNAQLEFDASSLKITHHPFKVLCIVLK
jgi:hypothetical protein